MRVTVVGAGVIGLTSAIRLRQAGFEADIIAAELPLETVASSVAGAIWYPYRSAADSREAAWGRISLSVFVEAARTGLPGLALKEMVDLRPSPAPDPWWADPDRGFRRCEPSELRGGYVDGYVQETAVIDVVPHLAHLADTLERLEGAITRARVEDLADLAAPDRIVVNCSGVGARHLAGDRDVHPVRGQVVRVRGETVDRVTIVDEGPLAYAYVMPHGPECVLGGTRHPGAWDRTPDDAVTEQILEKAVILEPSLAGADVVGVKVGLRPGREQVRLEHEHIPGTPGVIHNYGHGGNGWSLSWGCADEVVAIAQGLAA